MLNCFCAYCGKPLSVHQEKFCSRECYSLNKRNRVKTVCARCGKEFFDQPSDKRKYCSRKCATDDFSEKGNWQVLKCATCGKEHKQRLKAMRGRKEHYCSQECAAVGRKKFSIQTCPKCGKEFYPDYEGKIYCSHECRHEARRVKKVLHRCPCCHKRFWAKPFEKRKFCSQKCCKEFIVGVLHPRWEGGKHTNGSSYPLIRLPNHPRAGQNGYVMIHVLVMESYLGRPLEYYGPGNGDNEVVHHVDRNKKNFKIWNLELCLARVHAFYHSTNVETITV